MPAPAPASGRRAPTHLQWERGRTWHTHCRLPRVKKEASTLAAISGLRRRDTMPEMAVSGAGPFRKRPDYGLDAKLRAKTDDASSNWCSQVGPQILSPSASLYRGPIVQLEADLGSMLIMWARAGALQTPLQPPKITLCTYCDPCLQTTRSSSGATGRPSHMRETIATTAARTSRCGSTPPGSSASRMAFIRSAVFSGASATMREADAW